MSHNDDNWIILLVLYAALVIVLYTLAGIAIFLSLPLLVWIYPLYTIIGLFDINGTAYWDTWFGNVVW